MADQQTAERGRMDEFTILERDGSVLLRATPSEVKDLGAALRALRQRFPAAWSGRKPGSVVLTGGQLDGQDLAALCAVFRHSERTGLLPEERPSDPADVCPDWKDPT
jgi:hypothetical protein